MSTAREFQDMINEYIPTELLTEEFVPRDFILSKIEKDNGWLTGDYVVPFKGANASSVSYGQLTASDDVSSDKFVRGTISSAVEVWGTMRFNHRDLMEHNKVSEKNLLKLLPGVVEDFMDYMKNAVSVNLLNGAHFLTLQAAYTGTDGLLTVSRPDRLTIGQKVIWQDVSAVAYPAYCVSIDMNTAVCGFSLTRGGSANDFTAGADLVLASAKGYHDGAQNGAFSSLRAAFLSSANGGSASLYGQTKTAYPYLQAINVNGGSTGTNPLSITAVNIMEKIFDALTTVRQFGKGSPTDIVMSYKNFGSCIKAVEASKGAFNVRPGSYSASQFGWMEIEVGSVAKGALKLVGVLEADDDVIMFIDWRGLKFASNGFFQKRTSPDGLQYHEVRAQSGFYYLIDVCLFGDLVVERPSYQGIIFGISY